MEDKGSGSKAWPVPEGGYKSAWDIDKRGE